MLVSKLELWLLRAGINSCCIGLCVRKCNSTVDTVCPVSSPCLPSSKPWLGVLCTQLNVDFVHAASGEQMVCFWLLGDHWAYAGVRHSMWNSFAFLLKGSHGCFSSSLPILCVLLIFDSKAISHLPTRGKGQQSSWLSWYNAGTETQTCSHLPAEV